MRAVVNYLWSAALLGPIVPAEEVVSRQGPQLEQGLTSEGYREYLQLSLAALVYVPAGRWAEADAVLAPGEVTRATNRLVWLWLATGLALRRGDLELVDRLLPGFREERARDGRAAADPANDRRRDAASGGRRTTSMKRVGSSRSSSA